MEKKKHISAVDVAYWFINNVDRSEGDTISHLKVQKLVYYAQAWHLAIFSKPIFTEELRAWTHGPVSTAVYHEFKDHGASDIPPNPERVAKFSGESKRILNEVWAVYGHLSGLRLRDLTHSEAPWIEARGNKGPGEESKTAISKQVMLEFYKELNQRHGKQQEPA
jgi:uncharacterized phage-associated protein